MDICLGFNVKDRKMHVFYKVSIIVCVCIKSASNLLSLHNKTPVIFILKKRNKYMIISISRN